MPRNKDLPAVPVRTSTVPIWTQLPLLEVDDSTLAPSNLIQVRTIATLNGSTGIMEVGYEILDLEHDRTMALAHNVTPGASWDDDRLYASISWDQHVRAQRLLGPF